MMAINELMSHWLREESYSYQKNWVLLFYLIKSSSFHGREFGDPQRLSRCPLAKTLG